MVISFHMRRRAEFRSNRAVILIIFSVVSFYSTISQGFITPLSINKSNLKNVKHRFAKKGFGGGGGGSGFGAKATKSKTVNKKTIMKKLQQKYGGTTPQDIAIGTQKSIENAMKSLPAHLQIATQLYQNLQQWNKRLDEMSILQQTNIPQSEIDGAKRAQEELNNIYNEYNITEYDIHNIFQQITWDASADAKTARSITGKMSNDISCRIDKACTIVANAIGSTGRLLDVGCGFGTLIPILLNTNIKSKQIYGIDLSPEMIRNANELYPECNFEAIDFFQYNGPDDDGFDCILFCSALHDMPDPINAIKKAVSLLRPNGIIVIVHAQGAAHVLKQVQTNPILVKRGLPDIDELNELSNESRLNIINAPAKANTVIDLEEGYLAVLQKKE